MVRGIEVFRERFSEYAGMYTLIGGVACGLLMDEAGLDFRATKDFDVVLIVEALDEEFGKVFWKFIQDGGYSIRERNNGEPEFFRFRNPADNVYPKEIELFSRKSRILHYEEDDRLTPIRISDEISSLSAILLNDEYYEFLTNGLIIIDGIQVLNYTHLIPFKAKAWLDLKQRRDSGESADSKDILKHKRDVFRLSQLVTGADSIELCDEIKRDMQQFVDEMMQENIVLRDIGVSGDKDEILSLFERVYMLR